MYDGKTFRVLLIDDDVTALSSLRSILINAGFEVITARDGWSGLESVRQRCPDAVVCDRMLPGTDADHLRELLAHDPCTAAIPVVLFKRPPCGRIDMANGPVAAATVRQERLRDSKALVSALRTLVDPDISDAVERERALCA